MGDYIGLGIVILVIASSIFGVAKLIAPRKPISDVEFERRARENPGVLSSSVMGLQKVLEPAADKAVAVQQDLRSGRYNRKQARGDDDHADDSLTETEQFENPATPDTNDVKS